MEVRNRESFEVNFARTESYRKSAIPYCQRILNKHFQSQAKQLMLLNMNDNL